MVSAVAFIFLWAMVNNCFNIAAILTQKRDIIQLGLCLFITELSDNAHPEYV